LKSVSWRVTVFGRQVSAQADGTFWITGTAEGTVTFTPDDPSNASASGHFATWFGEASNNKNGVLHDTSTFVLTTTDGSHIVIHMRDHLSTNAQGVVTANFSVTNADVSCAAKRAHFGQGVGGCGRPPLCA
jgi:hypothetical protein